MHSLGLPVVMKMRSLLKIYVNIRRRSSKNSNNLNLPFHHIVTQFRSLVDKWLGYYRETLGVTKTLADSSRVNRPTLLSRSQTVSPRSVFSGGGDTSRPTTRLTSGRSHSRSSTYPMSSRQTSRQGTWNQTPLEPMNHSR